MASLLIFLLVVSSRGEERDSWVWPDDEPTLGCVSLDDDVWGLACPTGTFIVADMHDGDYKQVVIGAGALTITPHGNNQTWMVKAEYDSSTCSAPIGEWFQSDHIYVNHVLAVL